MNQKEPGEKPLFGILSGRELFYFLFSIIVVATLIIYGWIFFGDKWADSQPPKIQKPPNGEEVVSSPAIAISETKILYYNSSYPNHFTWRIYNSKTDEITEASNEVRALEKAGPYHEALTNGIDLSNWKGEIVLKARSTNFGYLIFQWVINGDQLQISKWADFSGGQKHRKPENITAVENGWLSSPYFADARSGVIDVIGNHTGSIYFTNPVPTNLLPGSCRPFQGGLYVTAQDEDKHLVGIFVLSLTNRAAIFSNLSVKPPVAFDYMYVQPDPSGSRVIWVFEGESKFTRWLREKDFIPSAVSSAFDDRPSVNYYSSDLHATKFHLILSVKHADFAQYIWGVNGDSIWLPDPEKGIKQYPLK